MGRLRIIAGSLKGRRIQVPGDLPLRPTADRVREALFSILGSTVSDALVLDAAVATTPGDSAAAPDDNTPDYDDAYVLVSDTGAEADQQIPEDQSGAVSDGGENALPIDDALDQFDTPMAEAGADADSDVTVAAEAEGGDTATGDDDGDPAAAETPDADGSDALNSPVLEAPAEMSTIFSGLTPQR